MTSQHYNMVHQNEILLRTVVNDHSDFFGRFGRKKIKK